MFLLKLLFILFNWSCILVKSCLTPVGVEDGRIPDDALTASSHYSASFHPNRARLNLLSSKYCWAAKENDGNQWLQVCYHHRLYCYLNSVVILLLSLQIPIFTFAGSFRWLLYYKRRGHPGATRYWSMGDKFCSELHGRWFLLDLRPEKQQSQGKR